MGKTKINDNSKVIEGFLAVAEAVSLSVGYNGSLALMESEFQPAPPSVTKDGISIARRINFKNKEKNMGAILAKQAANKTLVKSGDSTSTTLVLAKALIENCKKPDPSSFLQRIFFKDTNKYHYFNPKVKEGIEIAAQEATEILKNLSQKTDEEAVQAIATISANNDKELGEILLKAYQATGESGIIDVKENFDSPLTTLQVANGFNFKKGWKSPFLITDQKKATWEGENTSIIVFDGYVSSLNGQFIADALVKRKSETENANFLIVCERISDETLMLIVDNFNRGQLNICVVEAPDYENKRKAWMEDIALYANTEVFVQGTSTEIKFGQVDKVIVDIDSTTLFQENVSKSVDDKIENLKEQIENSPEKDFLQKRISALAGKAATIHVGHSMSEGVQEKKDRVDDAVCAIKSSLDGGWVAGGGTAFVFVSGKMNKQFTDKDVQFGYDALKYSLTSVMRTVCNNSGVRSTEHIISARDNYGIGFNAAKMEKSNLIKDKVIDSTKSLTIALENAKSVVNLLLNVQIVITL